MSTYLVKPDKINTLVAKQITFYKVLCLKNLAYLFFDLERQIKVIKRILLGNGLFFCSVWVTRAFVITI